MLSVLFVWRPAHGGSSRFGKLTHFWEQWLDAVLVLSRYSEVERKQFKVINNNKRIRLHYMR
jgi:hypothetical protein